MAKVLVLGGAGFIGFHLVKHLTENFDHDILVIDNLSRGSLDGELREFLDANPSVRFVPADLTDPASLEPLGRFDHVYLLAGVVGVHNVSSAPARVLAVNTGVILNTFNWLARHGCGRLLFASTSEAYAGSVELGLASVPTDETVPLAFRDVHDPRSTYALTKTLGESFLSHYSRSFGFEAVAVRFHNVYGPRMGYSHVVPELMQRIRQRMDPMPVYGLDQTRAFCYVGDAVRACTALMECEIDGPQIVNVGNDSEEVSITTLLGTMLNVTGYFPDIQNFPSAAGGVARRCPDISKLRALTGFEPQVNLFDGLKLTWDWYGTDRPASHPVGANEVRNVR
jgi:UDP-glucose 4-epimerase/UDP-glucuronate decarboxylase